MELGRRLRVELNNLRSPERLERAAARMGLAPPRRREPGAAVTSRQPKDFRRWVRAACGCWAGCSCCPSSCSWAGRWICRSWEGPAHPGAQKEILREVEIAPSRGIIYDRNQVELALSLETDSVYARPSAVDDRPTMAAAWPRPGPAGKPVIQRLKGKRHFVWVERRVDRSRRRR